MYSMYVDIVQAEAERRGRGRFVEMSRSMALKILEQLWSFLLRGRFGLWVWRNGGRLLFGDSREKGWCKSCSSLASCLM